MRFFSQYLVHLPIRPINPSGPADKALHDRMVKLVTRMLDLSRQRQAAGTPAEITRLDRDLAATDGEIDELVYGLHGLTKQESAMVEEKGE